MSGIKLLFVDNDKQIRNGLEKTIDWAGIGIDTVLTAKNGLEGIKLFMAHNPEIVIADIKMPGMDGLAMLQQMRRHSRKTHFFLLSGYLDAQYARQAIKMGVEEYFIKPIDIDYLVETLKQTVSETLLEKSTSFSCVNESVILLCDADILCNNAVLIKYGLRAEHEYMCCVTCEGNGALVYDSMKYWSNYLNEQSGEKECSYVIGDIGFRNNKRTWVVFSTFASQHKYQLFLDALYQYIHSNPPYAEDSAGIDMGISVSAHPWLPHHLYHQTLEALDYKFFITSDGGVWEYERLKHTQPIEIPTVPEEKMSSLIRDGMIQELEDLIYEIFELLLYANSSQITAILAFVVELGRFLASHLSGSSHDKLHDLMLVACSRKTEVDIDKLQVHIQYITNEFKKPGNEKQLSSIVKRIQNYIDNHYKEDITIENLSTIVERSPNYVSYIFKHEMGVSIIRYINKLRIECAQKLLKGTNHTAYEIATLTGFNQYGYFSRIFRQITGTTPVRYRVGGLELD